MVVSVEEWQDRHKKHVILHTLKTGRDWSVMSSTRKLYSGKHFDVIFRIGAWTGIWPGKLSVDARCAHRHWDSIHMAVQSAFRTSAP